MLKCPYKSPAKYETRQDSDMSILNLPIAVFGLAIFYLLYRRVTRNLIAELPGPKPESFVLGISIFHCRCQPVDTEPPQKVIYGNTFKAQLER